MSHSLIAKRIRRVSRKISENNMALASDSLFDKFGLWPTEPEAVQHATVDSLAGTVETSLPQFEDLNFDDLLEIKDEPILNEDIFQEVSNEDSEGVNDPFFNMESLMDDASLDSIKSDCMWSSVNLFSGLENTVNTQVNNRKRRRDVSLTLSECAEGLLSINHLDVVNMLDQIDNEAPLGSSPPFMSSSFGTMEEEEEDDLETTEDDDEDEDDEIDVVGTDLGGSSARTRHCNLANRNSNKAQLYKKIEAGRSLLKKQQPQKSEVDNKHKTILDDHCYFLARPQKDIKPLKGMLTPNESSEDEEDMYKTTSSLVDKRKIAEAVQSLIKNRPESVNNSNIKFKFRMKFKSTAAANNMKKAVTKVMNSNESNIKRERRKSASKNTFCPPPSSINSSSRTSPLKSSRISSLSSSSRTSSLLASKHANNNNNNQSVGKMDAEKCREIRDLHNSMERQRRVEQRNHLAHLKKQVPEVADLEKASKLTILRKAMDYCHLLSNLDQRIRKEKERELARNQMLRKKLMELSQKQDSRRVTASGRLTGWNNGRY